MFSIRFVSALAAAASLLSMASAQSSSASKVVSISEPTTTKPANAMQTIGCFSTGLPLEDHGYGQFATPGKCQLICLQLNKNVLGLSEGTNCWCGDLVPPESTKTDNSSCSTGCSGDKENSICGGKNKLWVMTTGRDLNPFEYADEDILPVSSSSTSKSSTTAAPTSVVSQTASATPTQEPEEKKSNTVGIAVGVVVGVVALCAIIAGVFFFLRHKKRREVEEEYRRQAANNSFIAGGKPHTSSSSMTDSRLDPEFMNRRQSNGSIADNEDYSRRILKVTNV